MARMQEVDFEQQLHKKKSKLAKLESHWVLCEAQIIGLPLRDLFGLIRLSSFLEAQQVMDASLRFAAKRLNDCSDRSDDLRESLGHQLDLPQDLQVVIQTESLFKGAQEEALTSHASNWALTIDDTDVQ